MTKSIDVHWHHVPKAFADAVVSGAVPIAGQVVTKDDGSALVKLDNGFKQPLPGFLTDPATIVADLDAAGLDAACASIAPPLSHLDCDPQIGLGVSRAINDAYAEVAEEHDGRILPMANVPLQDVDLALQELQRVVDDYGFKGVQVGSNIDGKNLGDESLFPFWERVRELDLVVFSHGLSPLGPERMKEHELKNFVGLPIDTAVSVASLVFGGVYERLPGLKIVFSHGGGAFPCLVGRWDHGYRDRLSKQDDTTIKLPSDYLVDVYADSLTHDPAAVRYLVERLGEDQVVLGSDHPFDMGEADPIGKVKEAIDDPAIVDKILGGTASRLLGLD
ncbi:MAG TPA: amidohydrolase family protein [Actinomycetota bacterium]|nr:amidohydrolase family protein [Actinomycetota bacterium]